MQSDIDRFFNEPILNSPYEYPAQHWELDKEGQPTNRIVEQRRVADFITPVPKPKKRRRGQARQMGMTFGEGFREGENGLLYNPTDFIQGIRQQVDRWRKISEPNKWGVTVTTQRLLQHWREHDFQHIRPFFCQLEAVETAIWLAEVAPRTVRGKRFLEHLEAANEQANPELMRIAFKLATGAGKTMVMAMMIAWQTLNAVRSRNSRRFTRGFLVVAPGITIRDRLRVLQPNDPDSYYRSRELVPNDMLPDLQRAKIVITNYHAFKLRERIKLAKGTRSALQGRGPELKTLETEGQMIQRVMGSLMSFKNILVLNDEAHHCYRERPDNDDIDDLRGDDKKNAQRENEAARLWINGIETVKRNLGVHRVYDLSATPFFLSGSGYREGTLFPWVASDFSLMDAIECGIVKLPRVPVADNIPNSDVPKFRNLWESIRTKMPKKGRGKTKRAPDPLSLPQDLIAALDALYGHYKQTYDRWQAQGYRVPPVFIVVCNNTSTSKLVYDYIAGFYRDGDAGRDKHHKGRLPLFRNYDEDGNRLGVPRTLLIDSHQLESGEALDKKFRAMSADAIDRFRREMIERGEARAEADNISDQDLLREVMNTVGKEGRLGEAIRCVVSVSMLTEGWDANTVTHVLGVRAFGTQLLCEQVVGRALRRRSYQLNESGKFDVEYADVLGIPFDFTARPQIAKTTTPRETVSVHAVNPERAHLEITFPRVTGYRVELPDERLEAHFSADSVLNLTPDLVGPTSTRNQGIIGAAVDLVAQAPEHTRQQTVVYKLTQHLLYNTYRQVGEEPRLHLFGQLKRITRQWIEGGYLRCAGGTYPAQLLTPSLTAMACERIKHAISEATGDQKPLKAVLDAYNPVGSSAHVKFNTSRELRWQPDPRRSHLNWIVCDSSWEQEFCRVVESHPSVYAYVKNQNLGLEVPYRDGTIQRNYLPDFIVLLKDGRGNVIRLIVEIKGFRNENAKTKASTIETQWIPSVNALGSYGRWAFVELKEVFKIEEEFDVFINTLLQS